MKSLPTVAILAKQPTSTVYSTKAINYFREKTEKNLGFPLREYTREEIQELAYRIRNVEWGEDGDTTSVLRTLDEDVQKYIFNEIHLCKVNFRYWMERYCHIVDDSGRMTVSTMWPSQEKFLEVLQREEEKSLERYLVKGGTFQSKIFLISLKARQVGATVLSQALIAHQTLFFPNTRTVIASDHPDTSLNLWQVFLRMYENLPVWMRPSRDAKVKATNLHLDQLGSDVMVGAGNQKTTFGQGVTVDAAHLTEVSTWDPHNTGAINEDLKPAFLSSKRHHSLFLLESTGKGGAGNFFHDQYQAARKGDSLFKSVFISWFMAPNKWSMDPEGIEIEGSTRSLSERIFMETGYQLTKGQMAFYQVHRKDAESTGDLATFLQEFPSTPEESFNAGWNSAFSIEVRSKVRNEVKEPVAIFEVEPEKKRLLRIRVEDWKEEDEEERYQNRLVIWEEPQPGCLYVIGVDTSYGMVGKDLSAIEVLRVGTRYADDEQVAEWSGTISPSDLAPIIEIVGRRFTDRVSRLPALVAIEANPGSPGIVPQTELMKRGYPYIYTWKRPLRADGRPTTEYGWWTTPATRPLLTEKGHSYITKGLLKINSVALVREMSSFIQTFTPTGRRDLEHAPGSHDDRIMALFIALYVAHENEVAPIADSRMKQHLAEVEGKKIDKPIVQLNAMGLSWEDAVAQWEESQGITETIWY